MRVVNKFKLMSSYPCLFKQLVYDPPHEIPWLSDVQRVIPRFESCACHPKHYVNYDDYLDKLVPVDLQNIRNPSELSGEQLEKVVQAIAQISLQGFVCLAWTDLHDYTSIDDKTLARFGEIFFESFTNHVLCIYDMEDLQRFIDRSYIIRSCRLFLDYLKSCYGEEPDVMSAERAMVDISEGKLLLNQFPFLYEQDVGFTLEYYHVSCNGYIFPLQVRSWPNFSSPVFEEYAVFEHHVKSVMKVLKEHVPLKVDERRDLLIDMVFEAGDMASALSLECLKEIPYEDFEKLNSKDKDLYTPQRLLDSPFLEAVASFSEKKRDMVLKSNKYVTFPLKSGVFGNFTAEVVELIELANVERRIVGQRFLSGDLIRSAILCGRIGDSVRNFLVAWEHTFPQYLSNYSMEENRPVYYIFSLANEIAKIRAGCGESFVVNVDHLFLATVFAPFPRNLLPCFLEEISVLMFLEASVSEASKPSSSVIKKMKYSKDYDGIEDKPNVSLNEEETEQENFFSMSYEDMMACSYSDEEECEEPVVRTQMEEFMSCCTSPLSWTPDFMKHINNALKRDGFDVRKKIFEVQEEGGKSGWCKRKKKFSWENIISTVV